MSRYRGQNEVQKTFYWGEIKQKEIKGGLIGDHQKMVHLWGTVLIFIKALIFKRYYCDLSRILEIYYYEHYYVKQLLCF